MADDGESPAAKRIKAEPTESPAVLDDDMDILGDITALADQIAGSIGVEVVAPQREGEGASESSPEPAGLTTRMVSFQPDPQKSIQALSFPALATFVSLIVGACLRFAWILI